MRVRTMYPEMHIDAFKGIVIVMKSLQIIVTYLSIYLAH